MRDSAEAPKRRLEARPPGGIEDEMASSGIPHFHNDPGAREVLVGSREFMCIGATPPFDHPHIFIDMGTESETICSYCGTLFKYTESLPEGQADPGACLWHDRAA